MNYAGKTFFELHYYEDQKTLMPVRFSVIGNDPKELPDTNFDVLQYGNRKEPFPTSTFTQNTLATCH